MNKEPDPKLLLAYIILLAIMFFFIGFIIGKDKKEIGEYNEPILEAYHIPILVKNRTLIDVFEYDMEMYFLCYEIIKCESQWNENAKNPNSTARGLFQIIKGSEELCEKNLGIELDMYNEKDNMICGKYLMEHQGLSAWKESRHCWDK